MKRQIRLSGFFIRCATVLLLLAGLSGCSTSKYITWNLRHSYNLAIPDKDWPGKAEKTLSPAQLEIYETRGKPDYIRFWWRNNPNFPRDTDPRFLQLDEVAKTKQSWIYTRQGDEVIFENTYSSNSVPISDKLAVIIKEGDPESRQMVPDRQTEQVDEVWQYISSGREYIFHGDTLIKVRQFSDPVSSYLKG